LKQEIKEIGCEMKMIAHGNGDKDVDDDWLRASERKMRMLINVQKCVNNGLRNNLRGGV